ncbi:5950_t:CDS:1 [Ambispora gerdemannii]|uniref:5950_t:CDS:1 n=1 Tax=Ambispora gerdemannii TaxID=144530 RepID=A0A9N8UZ04_9GLOM|nr:5950_t:CDS:1 [Ambispora gerdemannii]
MTYEITKEDFLFIVNKPRCRGTEIRNGNEKEGHENCGNCKGNYFVGGECNYGGRHTMEEELKQVNKNFEQFNGLVKKKGKISEAKSESKFQKRRDKLINEFQELKKKCDGEGKEFFQGSCIGLDGSQKGFTKKIKETFFLLAEGLKNYIRIVQNTTWEKIRIFRENLEKLEALSNKYTGLVKEYDNEKDPVRKAHLFALMAEKQKEIAGFRLELNKDPLFELFSKEKDEELNNIVKNIFHGDGQFFK